MIGRQEEGPEGAGVLGSLEARVLRVLWVHEGQALSVHEVLDELNGSGSQRWAYNSVMTVMARLADKGYLVRERAGRAHRYRPRVSSEEFAEWQAGRAAGSLLEQFGDAAVTGFVSELRGRPDLLRLLERILDEP